MNVSSLVYNKKKLNKILYSGINYTKKAMCLCVINALIILFDKVCHSAAGRNSYFARKETKVNSFKFKMLETMCLYFADYFVQFSQIIYVISLQLSISIHAHFIMQMYKIYGPDHESNL